MIIFFSRDKKWIWGEKGRRGAKGKFEGEMDEKEKKTNEDEKVFCADVKEIETQKERKNE